MWYTIKNSLQKMAEDKGEPLNLHEQSWCGGYRNKIRIVSRAKNTTPNKRRLKITKKTPLRDECKDSLCLDDAAYESEIYDMEVRCARDWDISVDEVELVFVEDPDMI